MALALGVGLTGCGGGMPSIPNLKNPFAKAKPRLPGERIAVLPDEDENVVDKSVAGRPILLPPPVTNASWAQPGGTATNDIGHLALGAGLQKVWSASAGTGSSWHGRLSAVPVVFGGKIFTLDAAGDVSAFSADNGAKAWETSVTPEGEKGYEGFGGGLAIDSGRLYVTSGFGTVIALNPDSGAILWNQKVDDPIRSSPTAAAGKIFFVSTSSVLHCLDGADGRELWTARGLPDPATLLSNVSPAVGQKVVIAPFPAGDVAAYQITDGAAAWTDSLNRTMETTAAGVLADPSRPVIDRGVVFAASHGGKMIASAETTGQRMWTRDLASTQMPVVAGDTVYVVDVSGKLLALTRADGKVRWVADLNDSARWSGPVLAGGQLWLVSAEGLVIGVDAKTGQVGNKLDLGTGVFVAPIVAGGRMYIYTDDAELLALQ